MDDLFFHLTYDDGKKRMSDMPCCATCKHIDWRALLVSYADETYHGYDGGCWCEKCEQGGRGCISPYWKACDAYEAKTPDDHIFEMCDHVLYALDKFAEDPEHCEGTTRHEVVRNVISNYVETVARFMEDDAFEWTRKRKEKNDSHE